MGRTVLGCFVGIGSGFLLAFLLAVMMVGLESRDAKGIILFVGVFLAGSGAIAGAVVGGVADLLEFYRKQEQDRQRQVKGESNSGL
jgi:hypothetical protein